MGAAILEAAKRGTADKKAATSEAVVALTGTAIACKAMQRRKMET